MDTLRERKQGGGRAVWSAPVMVCLLLGMASAGAISTGGEEEVSVPVPGGEFLAGLAFRASTDSDPCPGAAGVRTINVTALPTPISYNNWGDFDPHGRLFVHSEDVPDLLAQVSGRLADAGMDTFSRAVAELDPAIQEAMSAAANAQDGAGPPPDTTALMAAVQDVVDAADAVTNAPQTFLDEMGVTDPVEQFPAISPFKPSDLVQPFVARAHLGECVRFQLFSALPGPVGMEFSGVVARPGQGMALGSNPVDLTLPGELHEYVVYLPPIEGLEGAHLLRSPADARYHTKHGLFGALVAEPPSTGWTARDGSAARAGDQAIVVDPAGPDHREFVMIYHDEVELVDRALRALPTVSPYGEYGPGSKAINLRSEPFLDRFQHHDRLAADGATPRGHDKSQGYGSYTYGDPETFIPESYLGDPAKIRLVNAGPGQHHVHHLHGGGIRWRASPVADDTQFADGFLKTNPVNRSSSERLDVQNVGPGESFNLLPEGGSGGVQQSVGDFLFHCHIVEHYVAGMWSFWRVFDTLQPGLAPLPDRAGATPQAVDSVGLLGKTLPDGTVLTAANIEAWIESNLPTRGVPNDDEAIVWDWDKQSTAGGVLYLGEPETTLAWPNYESPTPGERPVLQFNPDNGRPAYPLLRPHFGERPPFAPDHGPAPYLSPEVDAKHPDGLCPSGAPSRDYRIVALPTTVEYNAAQVDLEGQIFVHAADKADVLSGAKDAKSLVLRANQGDCVDVLLTSHLKDTDASGNPKHSKVNMHIHLVQFDVQASDGVITGLAFEQSVRPAHATAASLTSAASAGDTIVSVDDTSQFRVDTLVAVGLTEDEVEIKRIKAVGASTLEFHTALSDSHAVGDFVGYEFVRYRWYPDVELGMVYWHDHVDGLISWQHGLFGGLVVEPKGSQWCDPKRSDADRATCDDQLDGHILDIVSKTDPTDPGKTYRELVVQVQDRACVSSGCTGGTVFPEPPDPAIEPASFNLRSQPFHLRNADKPLLSSATAPSGGIGGDPDENVLLEAYPDDEVVIRLLFAGQSTTTGVGTFGVTGHRFQYEQHLPGSRLVDTVSFGISSQHNLRLDCGAGGCHGVPGDYLYGMTQPDLLERGAWGLLRVHDASHNSTSGGGLQKLPSNEVPGFTGAVPQPSDPGVTVREYDVVAMEAEVSFNNLFGVRSTVELFALESEAAAIQSGALRPMPLVLRALPGEVVKINLRNALSHDVSISPTLLQAAPGDGLGIPVGDNADDTTAPGATRTYVWHADKEVGVTHLTSFGRPARDALAGLYGALVVEPAGSTFSPETGMSSTLTLSDGTQAREHVLLYASDDDQFEASTMPYLVDVQGIPSINYRSESLHDRVGGQLPSPLTGLTAPEFGGTGLHTCQLEQNQCGVDQIRQEVRNPLNPLAHFLMPPETPVLDAQPGQPVILRTVGAAGDQLAVHGLHGHWWALDADMTDCRDDHAVCQSNMVASATLGPREVSNAWIPAAGPGGAGDYLYGNRRDAFTEGGQWGILRVCPGPGTVADTSTTAELSLLGVVDLEAEEEATATSSVSPSCLLSNATRPAFQALREDVAGVLRNVTGDPLGFLQALVDDAQEEVQEILDSLACVGPTAGAEPVLIPPLAFTDPIVPGFAPRCVVTEDGGDVTWTTLDPIPHNPATLNDAGASDATRCFRASRDIGANVSPTDPQYTLRFRYDGSTLEVSADGGTTWRDCTAVMDPASDATAALLPYRCDIHTNMLGQIVVEA